MHFIGLLLGKIKNTQKPGWILSAHVQCAEIIFVCLIFVLFNQDDQFQIYFIIIFCILFYLSIKTKVTQLLLIWFNIKIIALPLYWDTIPHMTLLLWCSNILLHLEVKVLTWNNECRLFYEFSNNTLYSSDKHCMLWEQQQYLLYCWYKSTWNTCNRSMNTIKNKRCFVQKHYYGLRAIMYWEDVFMNKNIFDLIKINLILRLLKY